MWCVSVWLCNVCIFLCCSGYPGYSYPGGSAYPATGGPAHYQSQPQVTTVGELCCSVGFVICSTLNTVNNDF